MAADNPRQQPEAYSAKQPAAAELILWYNAPATQWVEALPVGNGRLGAMIFGGIEQERLQLNEDTLWSGGPVEGNNPQARETLPEVRRLLAAGDFVAADQLCRQSQGPFTQSYQPLGNLILHFDLPPASDLGAPASYRRQLDLESAIARVQFTRAGVTYTRELFASAPDQLIVMRLTADRAQAITFTATLDTPHHQPKSTSLPTALSLRCKAPAHVAPSYDKVVDPVIYSANAGMAFEIRLEVRCEGGSCIATATGLHVAEADAVTLVISAATGFNGYSRSPVTDGRDPAAHLDTTFEAMRALSYGELRSRHIDDHAKFFGRVSLELGTTEAANLPTDERIRRWSRIGASIS